MNPLVTIAIPTYNRADSYLSGCIQSALNQTYKEVEILISDNCSTDHTPELIKSFSDSRIRYVRQHENLGQRGNMNYLVQHARGDYFLMYHDDDIIDGDFIETCIKAADYKKGVGLIVTGSRVIDENDLVLREKENVANGIPIEDFMLLWYQKRLHLFFCCSLFGTNTLRSIGGFDEKYKHFDDVAAEFLCAARDGRIDVSEIKSSFREHPDSGTSSSDISEWCDSSLALLELACQIAPGNQELYRIGLKTSAERNYRYASELKGLWSRLCSSWIVMKKFNFRVFPPRKYIKSLLTNVK